MPSKPNADRLWKGMTGSPFAKETHDLHTSSGAAYHAVLLRVAGRQEQAAQQRPTGDSPG